MIRISDDISVTPEALVRANLRMLNATYPIFIKELKQTYPDDPIPPVCAFHIEWKDDYSLVRMVSAEYETPWLELTKAQLVFLFFDE